MFKLLVVVLALAVAWVGYMAYLGARSRRPRALEPRGGELRPCRRASNCVCTRPGCGGREVAPLAFTEEPQAAIARLAAAVGELPRTRVVRREGLYLHAASSSRIFGFVDDLEALADPAAAVIHLRSSSRVGISDRGVNARRVARLRQIFAARGAG